jgi:hypothetical protein
MPIPKNKRFHQFWNLNEGFFTLIPKIEDFKDLEILTKILTLILKNKKFHLFLKNLH